MISLQCLLYIPKSLGSSAAVRRRLPVTLSPVLVRIRRPVLYPLSYGCLTSNTVSGTLLRGGLPHSTSSLRFRLPLFGKRQAMSEFCESWRSSAAAVTRSRNESSPVAIPDPSFSYRLRRILANNQALSSWKEGATG
jgi:hypothetical protein